MFTFFLITFFILSLLVASFFIYLLCNIFIPSFSGLQGRLRFCRLRWAGQTQSREWGRGGGRLRCDPKRPRDGTSSVSLTIRNTSSHTSCPILSDLSSLCTRPAYNHRLHFCNAQHFIFFTEHEIR